MGRIERWYELQDDRIGGIYEYSNYGRVRVATELPVLYGKKMGDIIRPTRKGLYSLKALDNKFKQYTSSRLMLMTGVLLDEEALDLDGEEWREWEKGVFVSQYGRAKKDDKLLPIRITQGKGHRAYINNDEYIDMMQALCRLFFGVNKAVMKLEGDLCVDNIQFRDPDRCKIVGRNEFAKGYPNGWMFVYRNGFKAKSNHSSLQHLIKILKQKMEYLREADVLPLYMEAIVRDYIYETEYIFQQGDFGKAKWITLEISEYESGAMEFQVKWKGNKAFSILEPVSHGIERGFSIMKWKDVKKGDFFGFLKDNISFRRKMRKGQEETEETPNTNVSVYRTISDSSMGTGWTLLVDNLILDKADYYMESVLSYIKALLSGSYAQTKPLTMFGRIKEHIALLGRFYSKRIAYMTLEKLPIRKLDHGNKIVLKIYKDGNKGRPFAILTSPSPGFGFAWMGDSKRGRDIVIGDMVLPDTIESVRRYDNMVKKCFYDNKKGSTFADKE